MRQAGVARALRKWQEGDGKAERGRVHTLCVLPG